MFGHRTSPPLIEERVKIELDRTKNADENKPQFDQIPSSGAPWRTLAGRLPDACRTLPDAQSKRGEPPFLEAIRKTMMHETDDAQTTEKSENALPGADERGPQIA